MSPDAPPPTDAAVAWLAHPVTVLAVVLLGVNDHLLKLAYPGPLTGKLSDVAGLVVAPPVLATVAVLLARRLPARTAAYGALLLTGLGFAIVKALPAGAATASAIWSLAGGPSVIVADRTDLLALPALALAGAVAAATRRRPDAAVFRRPGRRTTRRIALLVVLPAAGLAMAATSAPRYPAAVAVVSWRSMIVVGDVNMYGQGLDEEPSQRWASVDGGRTWRFLSPAESAAFASETPPLAGRRLQQCAPTPLADHCYRVRPGHLRVEQSTDGGRSWAPSWEVADDLRQRLASSYDELGDMRQSLSSRALLVAAQPGGDYVVVVANGRYGYTVRDVTGRWARADVDRAGYGGDLPTGPQADSAPVRVPMPQLLLALLAGAVAAGAGFGRADRLGVPRGLAVAMVGVGVPLTLVGVLAMRADDWLLRWYGGGLAIVTVLVATATAVASTVVVASSGRVRTGWVVAIAAMGPVTAVGTAVPGVLWAGHVLDLRVASLSALATAVTGIALALVAAERARRNPTVPTHPPHRRRPTRVA